jgi:hypothetical protein
MSTEKQTLKNGGNFQKRKKGKEIDNLKYSRGLFAHFFPPS